MAKRRERINRRAAPARRQSRGRDEFPPSVRRNLAERVNYHCSAPRCKRSTGGPKKNSERAVILGVAAHITAAAANGPRYNRRLTPAQRRSFANGIWLCVFHGTHVDHDHTRYTVNQLRKWKRDAEARAHRELESAGGRSARPRLTNVVRARPRILYARQKGSAVHQGKGGPYQKVAPISTLSRSSGFKMSQRRVPQLLGH
jgi:hypothetical protein